MRELILDAPGKNSLSTPVLEQLRVDLAEAGDEPLLITGRGDTFSAGLNLTEVIELDESRAETFVELMENLFTELYLYPGPTVAAINGHAIAGGAVLALCCDYRIMVQETKARIGLNETPLGLPFPPTVLKLASMRLTGPHRERLLLEGKLFDAQTALEVGLVDEVSVDVLGRGREQLARLAAHPRAAYTYNKRTVRAPEIRVSEFERQAYARDALPMWHSDKLKGTIRKLLGK